jgi:2-methylcitrate dehydratase PrpD
METKALASFIANLNYEMLSASTQQMAKQCILDAIGCTIRGSIEAPGQIIEKVVGSQGGKSQATVLSAKPFRTTALNAALANGAFNHSLDFDDLHNASIIHLGTVVVPAALAVAEQIGASGQQLITAVVAGYEVGARVGEAVNPEAYFFWHTTGTAGTFGAAAAAAKLLELNAEQAAHCLGTAGTQAAGLWEFLQEGAMSKTLHAGKAAFNGILAAVLAKEGFTSASRILEGEKGFCLAMTPAAKLNKLTDGLGGGTYKIDENSFKPYACCKHCHAANNAAQVLRSKHGIESTQVKAINIKTNSVADNLVNNPYPQNAYGSKFSIQYCVAAALRYGKVGIEEFCQEKIQDAETRRMMQLVQVDIDPELDAEYKRNPDKWSVLVSVETVDGKKYLQFIEYPKGDPQNPVSYAESEEKFRSLAESVYSDGDVDKLLAFVGCVETVTDLSNMFDFLVRKDK